MQTFITDHNMKINFQNLDYKRLGKQRVETIQIARCLLVEESGWKNHPAVKMWKGYEDYLILVYLKTNIEEWKSRGYKGDKCIQHFNELKMLVSNKNIKKPPWMTDQFISEHRNKLIEKDKEFYSKIFI